MSEKKKSSRQVLVKQIVDAGLEFLKEHKTKINSFRLIRVLVKYSTNTSYGLCTSCFHYGKYRVKCPECEKKGSMVRINRKNLVKYLLSNDYPFFELFSSNILSNYGGGGITFR